MENNTIINTLHDHGFTANLKYAGTAFHIIDRKKLKSDKSTEICDIDCYINDAYRSANKSKLIDGRYLYCHEMSMVVHDNIIYKNKDGMYWNHPIYISEKDAIFDTNYLLSLLDTRYVKSVILRSIKNSSLIHKIDLEYKYPQTPSIYHIIYEEFIKKLPIIPRSGDNYIDRFKFVFSKFCDISEHNILMINFEGSGYSTFDHVMFPFLQVNPSAYPLFSFILSNCYYKGIKV